MWNEFVKIAQHIEMQNETQLVTKKVTHQNTPLAM
jgi:hypothetical protein